MKLLPSVTEVIAPWVNFSNIAPATLQSAAERGTAVHEACAMHAQGLWSFVTPPNIVGYVDSFRRWFDLLVEDVLLVEERFFDHRFGYHGQLDLLVSLKNAEIVLVDLKTPASLSRSWEVQLSAYVHLCEANGWKPRRAGTLRLKADGGVPKMEWYEDQSAIFNVFVAALNCHRFFNS